MENYFNKKLGETIQKKVTTGEKVFTEVFERVYELEVLKVKDGKVLHEVSSYDVTPSGYRKADTSNYFGEFLISIGNKSKNDIIVDTIKQADPEFFRRYGTGVIIG